MLPSRLFRNIGLPPALRSLITPRASLPPNIAVQLRLRLGVLQGSVNPASSYSTSGPSTTTTSPSSSGSTTPTATPPLSRAASITSNLSPSTSAAASTPLTNSQPLPEKLEPKLSLTFTCTVKGCDHRSTHEFSKRAYEKGIVLVECPNCKNRHLIADHLGWFKESTQDGKLKTVEDLLRAKGEKVGRGRIDAGAVVEYAEN